MKFRRQAAAVEKGRHPSLKGVELQFVRPLTFLRSAGRSAAAEDAGDNHGSGGQGNREQPEPQAKRARASSPPNVGGGEGWSPPDLCEDPALVEPMSCCIPCQPPNVQETDFEEDDCWLGQGLDDP